MKPTTILFIAGGAFLAYKTFGRKTTTAPANGDAPPSGAFYPQQVTLVKWNDAIKAQAQALVSAQYAEMSAKPDFTPSPSNMFVTSRDTAMAIWPELSWPITADKADAMVQGYPIAGSSESAWVVIAIDKGEPGHSMRIVWDKIVTDVVWPTFGYIPA